MDIIIKSLNRPYYLDRCLHSIDKFVQNFKGKIIILDDGTPQKYLDIIVQKHPKIKICKSTFYNEKSNLLTQKKAFSTYQVPIDLWFKISDELSDYFLILEDDVWFIEPINLFDIQSEMIQNQVVMTKLIWLTNSNLIQNTEEIHKNQLVILKPKLFTFSPFLYNFIFRKNYLNWHRRILAKFKIYTFKKHMAYYTIYSVAGTIVHKKYYKKCWEKHQNKIDETLQILNILKYIKQNKNNNFARMKKEFLRTGFLSSATNQFKEKYEGNIDMNVFNAILNEAWCNDEFEVYANLNQDLDKLQIKTILQKDKTYTFENWLNWVNSFKKQYQDYGCKMAK